MAVFVWTRTQMKPAPGIYERWPMQNFEGGGKRQAELTISKPVTLTDQQAARWQRDDESLLPELIERHPCPEVKPDA